RETESPPETLGFGCLGSLLFVCQLWVRTMIICSSYCLLGTPALGSPACYYDSRFDDTYSDTYISTIGVDFVSGRLKINVQFRKFGRSSWTVKLSNCRFGILLDRNVFAPSLPLTIAELTVSSLFMMLLIKLRSQSCDSQRNFQVRLCPLDLTSGTVDVRPALNANVVKSQLRFLSALLDCRVLLKLQENALVTLPRVLPAHNTTDVEN
ncbi:uncharacterized protein DEA37_0011551, partial [Paragonimus westermani]